VLVTDQLEAELRAQINEQSAQIALQAKQLSELIEQITILKEQLAANSSNSHKPPSSDPPGSSSKKTSKNKAKRKRGAQRGHKGSHRQLLPACEVDVFVDFHPPECESCWQPLEAEIDTKASRFQVTEIPIAGKHITEYRCHTIRCSCGYSTRASNSDVPRFAFGPRLCALVTLLTGVYHLSRRKTVSLLLDMVDVRISLGSVSAIENRMSEAIEPVVAEAWDKIPDAPVKHTDGTSWLQQGTLMSLWVIATAEVTVYKVLKSATMKAIRGLFTNLKGILVSDRDSSLGFWAMENRQICWAHLLRKFVSFSERDGPAGQMGQELLDYALLTFEYWQAFQSGEFLRADFQDKMKSVSEQFSGLLQRAVNAKISRFSGSCANITKHEEALWTFVTMDGVEPTNNHAERELRDFVLWRKRSFGSQSTRGNQYAERMMTVVKTARKQGRDILSLLIAAIEARCLICPTKTPSLFIEA